MVPEGANPEDGTRPSASRRTAAPAAGAWARAAGAESLDRVGRDGLLRLAFERARSRTVLTERRFRLPLQVLEPMDLDGSGAATIMLLNPTGGIVGGDRLDTRVQLGAGSHACLTTVAASRVYRSAGLPAVQSFAASVGEGAVLEYVPDHLIPSPGARLRQRTAIALAPGATALALDAWAVGRIARGERWRFAELDTELLIADRDGPLLRERAMLRAGGAWREAGETSWPGGLGGAEGFGYVATFAAVATSAAPASARAAGTAPVPVTLADWDALARELSMALDAVLAGAGRFGATALGRGGVVARLLLPSAPALEAAASALWGTCRARLLGRPPLVLRKL